MDCYSGNKRTNHWSVAAAAKSLQSYPTLCDPIDGRPPGSSVPGILQARTLEWVAISFSNAWKWSESEVAQPCLTPSDSMDCSLPGPSIHGIFQARLLEWVAIAFSDIIGLCDMYESQMHFVKWKTEKCIWFYLYDIPEDKTIGTECRLVMARNWPCRIGLITKGQKEISLDSEVFCL